MSTLREIGLEYQMLLEMMMDEEVDKDTIQDTIEGVRGELADKAECCIVVIDELKAKAQVFKDESKRLAAAAKVMENNIARIKNNLEYVMSENGLVTLETEFHKLRIQKNPDTVEYDVVDISMIPDEYHIPQPDHIDKKKILADIKAGKDITFAHIANGYSLRIR